MKYSKDTFIVCTGSLLGIKGYNKKAGKGIPVGFIPVDEMMNVHMA